MGSETGCVLNIQHYSLHDGAGIRTLVFLKGCPLRCEWCSNPESQAKQPELAFNANKCLGTHDCGRCVDVCDSRALTFSEGKVAVDRDRCGQCLMCVPGCPSRALHHFGDMMNVEQVINAVESNDLFHARSGGGVTLSGGEPLMQAHFTLALLREAKRRRMDTAMETCGYSAWEPLKKAAGYLDAVIYDVKSMDDAKHRAYTRGSNRPILKNLLKLRAHFPLLPMHIRTPLIPGFNDSPEEVLAICNFIRTLPGVTCEVLPYHRMGRDKYSLLGRDYALRDRRLEKSRADELIALAKSQCGDKYRDADCELA